MTYDKAKLLYEGKAKKAFEVSGHPELIWMEYKNSLTAFNAEKKGEFEGKGEINCSIATLIFEKLYKESIQKHFVSRPSAKDMICQKMRMIPLEVVVRNILAGSTAKKFHKEEGEVLKRPLVELFYKNDSCVDPFINDEQALYLEAVESLDQIQTLKSQALKINQVLKDLFLEASILLVDFKI
ncbi:MAG: phosphoribosylaminoimidazolesuccinocarboxamide synthase, partial [Bdellovibrionales bacterium]|nr:phosphoribosylaminoimidazolesuccinocarboxamide synthase [Bdellovibrionales bacterium]